MEACMEALRTTACQLAVLLNKQCSCVLDQADLSHAINTADREPQMLANGLHHLQQKQQM